MDLHNILIELSEGARIQNTSAVNEIPLFIKYYRGQDSEITLCSYERRKSTDLEDPIFGHTNFSSQLPDLSKTIFRFNHDFILTKAICSYPNSERADVPCNIEKLDRCLNSVQKCILVLEPGKLTELDTHVHSLLRKSKISLLIVLGLSNESSESGTISDDAQDNIDHQSIFTHSIIADPSYEAKNIQN